MNTSIENVNRELLKVVNTKNSLLVIYADAVLMGNITMIHSTARDVAMLGIIESALTNCVIFDRDDDFISDAIFKGREYINTLNLNSYVDFYTSTYMCNLCPNFISKIPNIIINNYYEYNNNTLNIYNIEYSEEWDSQDLIVNTVGQTIITGLRLNLQLVDLDALLLEVQGDNPLYTTTGNGYHIVGTELHWHDIYRLRPGMQIKIRWKL